MGEMVLNNNNFSPSPKALLFPSSNERSNDVCACYHQAALMFANEDNSRRFVKALVRMNRTQDLKLLASDSWGAKIHPVYGQEEAAVGTITILVKRKDIRGMCTASYWQAARREVKACLLPGRAALSRVAEVCLLPGIMTMLLVSKACLMLIRLALLQVSEACLWPAILTLLRVAKACLVSHSLTLLDVSEACLWSVSLTLLRVAKTCLRPGRLTLSRVAKACLRQNLTLSRVAKTH